MRAYQNLEITGSLAVQGTSSADFFAGVLSGSVLGQAASSITSSYAVTASLAATASHVPGLNFSLISTGSATASISTASLNVNVDTVITGSLRVSKTASADLFVGVFTGSFSGTLTNADTSSYVNQLSQSVSISGSLVVSESVIAPSFTGSLLGTASLAKSSSYVSGSGVIGTVSSSFTSSYVSGSNVKGTVSSSFTASLADTASYVATAQTASFITGSSIVGVVSNATNAVSASYTSTASFVQTLSQSVIIVGDLIVYGTQSVAYITSSQVNVGSNIITVNSSTPAVRFGGLAVFDSGSTGKTGSFLWDSLQDRWIYSNPSGSAGDSAIALMGPLNYDGIGNEQTTTQNAFIKGQGSHHTTSSLVTEDGTTFRVPMNTVITGSVQATNFTGSLQGTASFVSGSNVVGTVSSSFTSSFVSGSNVFGTVSSSFTASYVSGSNVIGTVSSSLSASYALSSSYASSSLSASYASSSLSASYASSSLSSSYALTASYGADFSASNVYLTGSLVASLTNQPQAYIVSYDSASGQLYYQGTGSFSANSASYADTASYSLTASYAANVPATSSYSITSSYAITASYLDSSATASNSNTASYLNTLHQDVSVSGSLGINTVTGTSFDLNADTFIFTGSMFVTGSAKLNGSLTTTQGYITLTQVSQSLNFQDDAAAATGGVPLGGLYRNGNFIVIRLA